VFIEYANKLSQGGSGTIFQTGDARNLDFADESFDLVVSHTMLCHVPDPEKAINEAARRVESGEFFGHISYVSLIARKPSPDN